MNYSKGLDGLRGISVIFVVLYHYGYLRFGWVGVQMFFVLSGYLITNILIEEKEANFYFYNFYIKRALRIFPLYFLYLALLSVLYLTIRQPSDYTDNIAWLVVFTYNIKRMFFGEGVSLLFTHFWSLSVEEQFYLLWPFLVYKISEINLKKLLITLLVATPLIRYVLIVVAGSVNSDVWWLGSLVYNATFCQMDAFAVGASIAIIGVNNISIKPQNIAFIISIILILGLIVAYYKFGSKVIYAFSEQSQDLKPEYLVKNWYMHVWFYSVVNLLAGAMIVEILTSRSRLLIDNKILVYIGKISYGIYVYHLPLLWWIKNYVDLPHVKYTKDGIFIFLLYVLSVLTVSAASYHFFEYRFLKLKRILVKS